MLTFFITTFIFNNISCIFSSKEPEKQHMHHYLLFILLFCSLAYQGIAQSSPDMQEQLDSLKTLNTHIATLIQDLQTKREEVIHEINTLQYQNQTVRKKTTTEDGSIVIGNGGIMRKSPEANSESISFIPSGSLVLINNFYQNSYFRVTYDGKTGYLKETALQAKEELLTIKQHWRNASPQKTVVLTEFEAPVAIEKSYPARKYITGPRGGCYYMNSAGNKTYTDRSFCGSTNNPVKSYSGRTYYKSARGGCYYINSNGNKSYVARSMRN